MFAVTSFAFPKSHVAAGAAGVVVFEWFPRWEV